MPGGPMSRTVPTMATITPGNYATAAWEAANVAALGNYTLGQPVFSGYQSTIQSVATGAFVSLLLDTETLDSDNGHSTSTNTSRYTATVPGTYLVIGSSGWAANGAGYRRVQLALNGTAIIGSAVGSDASQVVQVGENTSAIVVMNGTTDYVEVQGSQSSGGALSTAVAGAFAPSMRVFWLSR